MPGGDDQFVDRGRGESLREHRRLGEVEESVAGGAALPDRHVEHAETVLWVRKGGCDGGHSSGVDVPNRPDSAGRMTIGAGGPRAF